MKKIKRIKTGLIRLDAMMGGGIPVGRIIEVYGYPHSGKTTLALEIAKVFKKTLLIDYEHETDPDYHKALNVKVDVVQPMTFEQGVDDFFKIVWNKGKVKKSKYDCLIVDSIGSAITNRQLEKDIADNTVGELAQAVTKWCRKAEKIFKPLGITAIVINHRKQKIGGFGGEYSTGGMQLKHSAGIRLALHGSKNRVHDDGVTCNIRQVKNKVCQSVPFDRCEYLIERGKGVSRGYEIFLEAEQKGIIKKSGHWYKIGEQKFQGLKALLEVLDSSAEIRNKLYDKITQDCD